MKHSFKLKLWRTEFFQPKYDPRKNSYLKQKRNIKYKKRKKNNNFFYEQKQQTKSIHDWLNGLALNFKYRILRLRIKLKNKIR